MSPLRIGVNALYLIPGGVGGTEIYLRSLLAAMAGLDGRNQYFVYMNAETDAGLCPQSPNFHARAQRVQAAARPARLLWEQTVLPWQARRDRLDVMFNPGFTAPVAAPCANVTVFHDLQHRRHPEYFRWFDLPFWRLFLYLSARCSRGLIAVSEATRADLVTFYPFTADRVRVVLHGVDERFFQLQPAQAQTPYILCVSTLHPHKNLDRLVRAFLRFRQQQPEYRLVLAGLRGFFAPDLEQLVSRAGAGSAIEITGWLPRDDLYALFAGARAFVYPSSFEGFGMPVLEAMAAGLPTGCADLEPMRSIAQDAALWFDPTDESAIAAAIGRLCRDEELRARLRQAGPRRAAGFSWRKTAQATLQVLEEAARSATVKASSAV